MQRKIKPNFHDSKHLLFEKFFEKMFYFYHFDVSKNGELELKTQLLWKYLKTYILIYICFINHREGCLI